jgi:hypothetical protein
VLQLVNLTMHCWVYICARRCLQWRTITHFPLCKRSADLRVGHCSYTSPLLLHPTFRSSAGECVSKPPPSERASAAAVPTTPTNTLEHFFALVAALSRHFLRLRNRAEKSSGASGRKSIKLVRGRFGVFGLWRGAGRAGL